MHGKVTVSKKKAFKVKVIFYLLVPFIGRIKNCGKARKTQFGEEEHGYSRTEGWSKMTDFVGTYYLVKNENMKNFAGASLASKLAFLPLILTCHGILCNLQTSSTKSLSILEWQRTPFSIS